MFKTAILLLLAVLTACTTTQSVAPAGPQTPAGLQLKVGDTIQVVTKYRERMSLRITAIGQTELTGVTQKRRKHDTQDKGKTLVIPYDDLALVQVKHGSAGRTIIAVPLVLVGAVAVAVGTGQVELRGMSP